MAMDYNRYERGPNEFAEAIKQMVDDGIAKATAELAREMTVIDASQRGPSIRMECIQTVVRYRGGDRPSVIIAEAEELAQYIISGKKPGEA